MKARGADQSGKGRGVCVIWGWKNFVPLPLVRRGSATSSRMPKPMCGHFNSAKAWFAVEISNFNPSSERLDQGIE
jgi:hypothetical protein